jgi:hypothetical protein
MLSYGATFHERFFLWSLSLSQELQNEYQILKGFVILAKVFQIYVFSFHDQSRLPSLKSSPKKILGRKYIMLKLVWP